MTAALSLASVVLAMFSFLAEIINDHRELYFEKKSHREKREYTMAIVESICEDGRFLKRDKHTWKEASFETARQKVAHAMQYRQRCLLNNVTDFNEETMEDNESTSSSIKYDVQTSDETTDNTYATTSIECGFLTRVTIADASRQVDSSFLNAIRTSSRVNADVQYEGADDNVHATSSIEPGLPTRVDISSQGDSHFMNLNRSMTSTTSQTCPAKIRVVSNEMGLHVPNAARYQQFRTTYDSTNIKHFCSREHDAISDLVFMPSQLSQPLNAAIGKSEVFLPKSSDEQSTDGQMPTPAFNSLLRGTSDFSFGDFSLDGEFMSSVEGGDHLNM
jgi:hypothetical protein